MTIAVILLILATDAPEPALIPHSLAGRVEQTLAAELELLGHHRGYLAYLDKHEAFARAEQSWRQAALLSEVRPLARRFDESLARNPEAEALFDRFYDALAQDRPLREAVEQLQRFEFEHADWTRKFNPALEYLRAHPGVAQRLLRRPRGDFALPQVLRNLPAELRNQPDLLGALREAYGAFAENPAFLTRALPWWQMRYGMSESVAEPAGALTAMFLQRPHRFWLWHQRNLALAGDAQARGWIRYWFRRVRREPGLADDYPLYLHYLRQRPEQRKHVELKWQREFGAPPAWPPASAPPPLEGRVRAKDHNAPDKPTYVRPERPEIKRPQMPEPPGRPPRPAMPAKPKKPEVARPTMKTAE